MVFLRTGRCCSSRTRTKTSANENKGNIHSHVPKPTNNLWQPTKYFLLDQFRMKFDILFRRAEIHRFLAMNKHLKTVLISDFVNTIYWKIQDPFLSSSLNGDFQQENMKWKAKNMWRDHLMRWLGHENLSLNLQCLVSKITFLVTGLVLYKGHWKPLSLKLIGSW